MNRPELTGVNRISVIDTRRRLGNGARPSLSVDALQYACI